jgi:polysaccharide pyruvyl transferase WcaK-like protein
MKSRAQSAIFLSGYFGCGNLGDDLLLSTTVTQLRLIAPQTQFLVRDSGDTGQLTSIGAGVVFTGIDTLLAEQKYSKARRLARYLVRLVALLRRCRWLIFAGGTVFHEANRIHSLLVQWLICRAALLLRVRIAALGVGISDLKSTRARWLMHDIVRMSELFLVRDEAGLRQCAGTSARLTDDLVFVWTETTSISRIRAHKQETDAKTIALTVCPAAFTDRMQERADAFSNAVRIWQLHGHRVIFLVFQRTGVVAGDEKMFERITARLPNAALVTTRMLVASGAEIAAAYRDIDMLCGMRFHGFVLAALLGIPFVGIAHDNKISEICRRFDMPCLDAAAFEGSVLAQLAEKSFTRRPDPILVERSIADARENFRALAARMQ